MSNDKSTDDVLKALLRRWLLQHADGGTSDPCGVARDLVEETRAAVAGDRAERAGTGATRLRDVPELVHALVERWQSDEEEETIRGCVVAMLDIVDRHIEVEHGLQKATTAAAAPAPAPLRDWAREARDLLRHFDEDNRNGYVFRRAVADWCDAYDAAHAPGKP